MKLLAVALVLLPVAAFAQGAPPPLPPLATPLPAAAPGASVSPADEAVPAADVESEPFEPDPPRRIADVSPEPARVHSVHEAGTGFQLHFGAGYTKPFGPLAPHGGSTSDLTPGQLMVLDLGIGAKLGSYVYLGAYLAGGSGPGPAGCVRCASGSAHLGIEAELSLRPAARWNPWIGYGIGVDSLVADLGDGGKVSYVGPEYARLTAGVDLRLTHAFGVGPYLGVSLGRYSDVRRTTAGVETASSLEGSATHGWFSLGVRLVLFP